MTIIVNDHDDTTSSAVTLSVPLGQANHMLLGFTHVHETGWTSGDPEITRGTPSGGGGSWIALNNEIGYYVEESGRRRQRVYSWYSYPTQTGDISISVGSYSGDGRYSVFYALANAVFYESNTVAEVEDVRSTFATSRFSKQGSTAFCLCSAELSSTAGVGPYTGSTLAESQTIESGAFSCYGASSYKEDKGQRTITSPYYRYTQPGINWGLDAYSSVGVFISVDSVECEI